MHINLPFYSQNQCTNFQSYYARLYWEYILLPLAFKQCLFHLNHMVISCKKNTAKKTIEQTTLVIQIEESVKIILFFCYFVFVWRITIQIPMKPYLLYCIVFTTKHILKSIVYSILACFFSIEILTTYKEEKYRIVFFNQGLLLIHECFKCLITADLVLSLFYLCQEINAYLYTMLLQKLYFEECDYVL